MFDPWQIIRSLQRQNLAILVFMVTFMGLLAVLAWLAPELLDSSFLPILLLAVLAAYASWRWSRDHL